MYPDSEGVFVRDPGNFAGKKCFHIYKHSAMSDEPASPRYSAPALEKGLDIIEWLAQSPEEGYSQKAISDALGRSQAEIFRMLVVLERRGYLRRGPGDDRYRLTAKLYALANAHPPTCLLLDHAMPSMRRFTEATRQSCHLAIYRDHQAVIVAQVDSPSALGVAVRQGSAIPVASTASGQILLAFADGPVRNERLEQLQKLEETGTRKLQKIIKDAQNKGGIRRRSEVIPGVTDLARPIFDHAGHVAAALTCPFIAGRDGNADMDAADGDLQTACSVISQLLGWDQGEQI